MVDAAATGAAVVVGAVVVVGALVVAGAAVDVAVFRCPDASNSEELDPPQADPNSTRISKAFLNGILKVCHP